MKPFKTPTGTYIGTWPTGSPEWHTAREKGLGGSEIAAVIGLSPWESRFSLFHRKAGTIPPLDLKDEMEWGHRLEPAVAAKFQDNHPEEPLALAGTYAHKDRPWMVANPDRLRKTGPLEIKYSLFGDEWGEPGTEQIPPYYRVQGLWYLDVLGYSTCDVAVFIGGSASYREYVIHANPVEQEWLRDQAKDFLDELDTGTPPPIDGSDATYQAVRELHPEIDGTNYEIPADLAFDYLTARAARSVAQETFQATASRLLAAMGQAQYAVYAGARIAARRVKNGGTPYLQIDRNPPAVPNPRSAVS